ncbi:MAG: T9SS C-terminal target domain-containing protein, partial [Candidatus Zixiibacteriota bacterium]
PDGDIDFDDLIAFAINYDQFRCGGTALQGGGGPIGIGGKPIADAVNLTAEVPVFMEPNREYTISLRVSDPGAVKGYHLVFDYDHDMIDVVDIEAGQAFSTVDQSFFYVDSKSANVDITGVVFGADAMFADNEIATVTIRSKASGRLMFSDDLLDVRDHEGQPIDVAFSLNGSTNPGMLPTSFSLSQNYPNPFNPTTTIQLALPTASNYRLTIYNIAGQVVDEFSGYSEAGFVTIDWDASRLASGIYLYRVVAGSFTDTKKMVLLK